MGMLFAPVGVVALIAIGAVSVYVGRRVASRTYNQPMRMALFSVGSIVTGALIWSKTCREMATEVGLSSGSGPGLSGTCPKANPGADARRPPAAIRLSMRRRVCDPASNCGSLFLPGQA